MRFIPAALAALALPAVAGAEPSTAESPTAPTPAPSPESAAAPASTAAPSPVTVGGFVDFLFAWNTNRPADHANFIPGTGSTAKRFDELSLNLAALDVSYQKDAVVGRLTLNVGTGTQVIHAGEPTGVDVGPQVWDGIYQAYLGYKVPIGNGLEVDAGVFPCHIGFEGYFSKDNWNYTRSWVAELVPYYLSGVRALYAFSDSLSVQLNVSNGWQIIADNNNAKTFGAQVAWNTSLVSLTFNGIAGPEQPDDDDHWRLLGDFIGVLHLGSSVDLAVNADYGHESRPAGADAAQWHGEAGYVRVHLADPLWLALRGDYFHDPDGAISGAKQDLVEGTATIEYRPADSLILKLEGRHDHSTKDVFTLHDKDSAGAPKLGQDETLAVLGAVVTF
jgi:hypothetical protein